MVVGEVQHGESTQFAYISRDLAGDFIPDEVEDSQVGKRGDARRDFSGDILPVGDDEGGEAVELADGGGDRTGHVAGAAGLFKDWVLGLPTEDNISDPFGFRVAADAVPVGAAVGA